MTDTHALMIADALRVWGFLAAIVGFDDLRTHWLLWRLRHLHPDFDGAWMAVAKIGLYGFLFLAGVGIPLARRIGIEFQAPSFEQFMAVCWALASMAGWAFVISRAANTNIMAGVAAGAFIVAMIASWATFVA